MRLIAMLNAPKLRTHGDSFFSKQNTKASLRFLVTPLLDIDSGAVERLSLDEVDRLVNGTRGARQVVRLLMVLVPGADALRAFGRLQRRVRL